MDKRVQLLVLAVFVVLAGPLERAAKGQVDTSKALFAAADQGDLRAVREALGDGADVDSQHVRGNTPLIAAARGGHLSVVQLLLKNGANKYKVNNQGWDAMTLAAYKGQAATIGVLLKAGFSLKSRPDKGYYYLYQAVRWGYLPAVKLLVEQGRAPLQHRMGQNKPWRSALVTAIREAKGAQVATYLVGRGARVNITCGRHTPLMAAVGKRKNGLVRLLLQTKAKPNVAINGHTALIDAALSGNLDAARMLLDARARVDHKDDGGTTALFHAAHGGRHQIVTLLLDRGATARVVDKRYGDTALMRAANNGHNRTVQLLLKKGARVNAANKKGLTPLMMAARNGKLRTVKLLLTHKADLNAKDRGGSTALMLAAKSGQKWVARHLKQAGAQGYSPAHAAQVRAADRSRISPDRPVEQCIIRGLGRLGRNKVCSVSLPARGRRRFELHLRDTSRLDRANRQTANHALIAKLKVPTEPEEYMGLGRAVAVYELTTNLILMVLPIYRGTPNHHSSVRRLLYIYNVHLRRFHLAWRSPRCTKPCAHQTIQLRTKGSDVTVLFLQGRSSRSRSTTRLKRRGYRFVRQ